MSGAGPDELDSRNAAIAIHVAPLSSAIAILSLAIRISENDRIITNTAILVAILPS